MTLNKGDIAMLLASQRVFEVIDEKKGNDGEWNEYCKFDDSPRDPVWLPHRDLAAASRKLDEQEITERKLKRG